MATVKFHIGNGQFIEGEAETVTAMLKALGIGASAPSVVESGKGSATATAEKKDVQLTDEQKAIVNSFKPTHRLGTDKGSIHNCLRECAYAFCGGKDKYKKDLYTLGKMAWFKAYDKTFREALPETI